MGKLTELEQWDDDIYQIETSDPVLGGPDGITNKPAKQLANRTLWLKKQIENAGVALEEHVRSRNHPDASLIAKGFVKLYSGVMSLDETMAATPKAVKIAMDNANARLAKDRNLADLPNPALARQSLELGNSATRNVGTTTNTIAAGDDPRFTSSAQKANNLSDLTNPADAVKNLGLTEWIKKIEDTQLGLPAQPILWVNSPDDLSNLPAGARRFAANNLGKKILPVDGFAYIEVIGKGYQNNSTCIRLTGAGYPGSDYIGVRFDATTSSDFTWAKQYSTLNKPTAADVGTDTTAQINTKVADAKKAGTDAQLAANAAQTAASNAAASASAANTNANGRVPNTRTVNGKPLSTNIAITSQDIFDTQATHLGVNKNLNTVTTPGIYYQNANVNTSLALNYPEALAGTLLVFKSAGITQVYYVYNSSRVYTRSQYAAGIFTPWAREYNTQNKPTAAELGITIPTVPKNTALKAVNGWWKCGDTGLIIQWGTVPVGSNGTANYPLPIPFPNKGMWAFGYCSAAMPYDNDAISGSAGLLSSAPNTTIRVTTDNGVPTAWMAIGY